MPKTVVGVDADGNQHQIQANELRWRPSAYAMVVRDGKLLLSQEGKGKYMLPGGGIELGEPPEATVLREVWEETGIRVANPRPIGFASNLFVLTASQKGKYVQSILLYYQCDFVSGELSLDNLPAEDRPFHDEPVWLPLTELPGIKLASSIDWRPFVEKALRPR